MLCGGRRSAALAGKGLTVSCVLRPGAAGHGCVFVFSSLASCHV